jgi:methylenetetrahydrofolate reductase (NADPH)
MHTLREKLSDPDRFLLGVELVTTRGTMADAQAMHARTFATELVQEDRIDWVSITDNAGGNPQLSPMALGKPILYAGKEVLIHLSCKDFNRNGLESAAWELASEGFHNILALSGDYPAAGYHGRGKPVFDIDSIGLLTMLDEMNRGLARPSKISTTGKPQTIGATDFFAGAVATNFKRFENEVVPQLLKLEQKVARGAKFIIAQIGYDARKSHEMLCYMRQRNMGRVPLVGNVFLLSAAVARFFRKRTIPGVVISDALFKLCDRHERDSDRGAAWFKELAAKQLAIFRGLGFAGGYLGGVHRIEDVREVLDIEASFAPDDWKLFAREIQYPVGNEFYYYARDEKSSLADASRLEPAYEASLNMQRKPTRNVTLGYRFSKRIHDAVFTPGKPLYKLARRIYAKSKDPMQGPRSLRVLEHVSKLAMFGCKDCGDCSLPDIGYLCPESQCAKNQRNGPCGGTRDGKCEVSDFECIWSRAYDRMKYEGCEQQLLVHAPVIQDETLRGTSSWANALLGRDHTAKRPDPLHACGHASAPEPERTPDDHRDPPRDRLAPAPVVPREPASV